MLQAIQGGVERSLLDLQGAARDLLDSQQDAVPMHVSERYRLEDEEVEGPWQKVGLVGHGLSYVG
jgi:hypothetical protein